MLTSAKSPSHGNRVAIISYEIYGLISSVYPFVTTHPRRRPLYRAIYLSCGSPALDLMRTNTANTSTVHITPYLLCRVGSPDAVPFRITLLFFIVYPASGIAMKTKTVGGQARLGRLCFAQTDQCYHVTTTIGIPISYKAWQCLGAFKQGVSHMLCM